MPCLFNKYDIRQGILAAAAEMWSVTVVEFDARLERGSVSFLPQLNEQLCRFGGLRRTTCATKNTQNTFLKTKSFGSRAATVTIGPATGGYGEATRTKFRKSPLGDTKTVTSVPKTPNLLQSVENDTDPPPKCPKCRVCSTSTTFAKAS